MTRELTRGHLEALLVAIAIIRPESDVLPRVDQTRLTPAARALLAQLHDDDVEMVWAHTIAERALRDRVDALTVADLTFFEIDTVVALVNRLPETARPRTSVALVGLQVSA